MEDFINALEKVNAINGKIIGAEGDFIEEKLANTDRQAWVNHMVDQHLKHEPIDSPPPEFKISMNDIVKEISKREINKIFRKK